MSEAILEIQADFPARSVRDKAIEFLNDEGPAYEEEVKEVYRDLFPLQENIEHPEEVRAIDSRTLYAFFQVGGYGVLQAMEYMKIFYRAGARRIFAIFNDDEGNQEGWTIIRGKLIIIYRGYEDDPGTAELLSNLCNEDRLPKLIELYESGVLKAKS